MSMRTVLSAHRVEISVCRYGSVPDKQVPLFSLSPENHGPEVSLGWTFDMTRGHTGLSFAGTLYLKKQTSQ